MFCDQYPVMLAVLFFNNFILVEYDGGGDELEALILFLVLSKRTIRSTKNIFLTHCVELFPRDCTYN